MKYYKDDSEIEIAVQKVEALMQELNLSIEGSYLTVYFKDIKARICDVESNEQMSVFPRQTDSEKLIFEN